MTTNIPSSPPDAPVQASLYELLAPFTGNQYRFLLAFLKDPAAQYNQLCDTVGIAHQTLWSWRSTFPNFRIAMDAVKEAKANLRVEYARLAFLNATPKIADAMVDRATGEGVAAQRAGERILETVGVLPTPNAPPSQAPVQVTTYTYYLVQPGVEPKAIFVETTKPPKELGPGESEPATGDPP